MQGYLLEHRIRLVNHLPETATKLPISRISYDNLALDALNIYENDIVYCLVWDPSDTISNITSNSIYEALVCGAPLRFFYNDEKYITQRGSLFRVHTQNGDVIGFDLIIGKVIIDNNSYLEHIIQAGLSNVPVLARNVTFVYDLQTYGKELKMINAAISKYKAYLVERHKVKVRNAKVSTMPSSYDSIYKDAREGFNFYKLLK
jgi:hypothetical protein